MTDTVRRLLVHAAAKLGGEAQLADALGLSEVRLKAYIRGVHPVPGNVFLRAVDVLMETAEEPQPPAAPDSDARPSGPRRP